MDTVPPAGLTLVTHLTTHRKIHANTTLARSDNITPSMKNGQYVGFPYKDALTSNSQATLAELTTKSHAIFFSQIYL